MNGDKFLEIWRFSECFSVHVHTVQSHRYSSEVNYWKVKTDNFKFFVLYVTVNKLSDDEFSITGYLNFEKANDNTESASKILKNWIFTKNLVIKKKHCIIEIIDESIEPFSESLNILKYSLSNCPEMFIKVGNKSNLSYGDGGECKTNYQLYIARKVADQNSKEIIKFLVKLGKERNDWNPQAPVLDIIDPELYPVYFSEEKWIQNRLNIIVEEDPLSKGMIRKLLYAQTAESMMLSDPAYKRYKYHWKPINIVVDGEFENITFLTSIPGLPRTADTELFYKNISEVFKTILPALQNLGVVEKGIENKLQIILKAQLYRIGPGTSYEGKWHTEGVTERIIAVGTYYLFTHSFLEDGNLEFSLKNYPDEYYSKLRFEQDYPTISIRKLGKEVLKELSFIEEVDVSTNTAIVFSNDLPHRFKKIINKTDKNGYRIFINFFVVDPKHPLSNGDEKCPLNDKEILEQREAIREVLLKTPKGWGHIHYGNVGEIGYIDRNVFGKPIEQQYSGRDIRDFIDQL